MNRETPIIFNDAMVRAILAGRKTQTRRPASITKLKIESCPEYARDGGQFHSLFVSFPKPTKGCISTTTATSWTAEQANGWIAAKFGPFGSPGDLLWVREAWAHVPRTAYRMSTGVQQANDPNDADMAAVYRSGWERSPPHRWRPSIHMPRWASRLTLRVKRVWVERAQEISPKDIWAEGISHDPEKYGSIRHTFEDLWDSIYSDRYPWHENPWVWCCEFEVVK